MAFFNITKPIIAESAEANNILNLAPSNTSPSNAVAATTKDIVKPTPARNAAPIRLNQDMSLDKDAKPNFEAIQQKPTIPSGLPMQRPAIMPILTAVKTLKCIPNTKIPVLKKAKRGRIE